MEGVMMKNKDQYAVAVRKPDGEIIVDKNVYRGILPDTKIKKTPFIRGVLNFIESLTLGMKTLMYSASFFEEEPETRKKQDTKKSGQNKESAVMGMTMAVSVSDFDVVSKMDRFADCRVDIGRRIAYGDFFRIYTADIQAGGYSAGVYVSWSGT